MKRINLYCLLTLILSNSLLAFSKNDEWEEFQYKKSLEYLLSNISRHDTPKGFIVASPSKYDPNYYYHWVRDAALVMSSLGETLKFDERKELFENYIRIVAHHQNVYSLTGLGEPKFNPDGTSFKEPWGRPQNDGPALRSITLMRYARELLKKGKTNYVKDVLFGGDYSINIIKKDLDYVVHNWRKHDFDLWEEVKGHHFYTRYVQRAALMMGSRFALSLGDEERARIYREEAIHLDKALDAHWSDKHGYVLTTLNRVGGLSYKYSNLDASVVLAVNHASLDSLSFGIDDERILVTAWSLVKRFKKDYKINSRFSGVGIGRYPEDTYYGGNPWFLLTAGMAEYFYSLADEIESKGSFKVSDYTHDFYESFLSFNIKKGLVTNKKFVQTVVKRIRIRADQFLGRIKTHAHPNGQLDEQFNKNHGFMVGAKHLTWSYAAFLTAINEKM